MRRVSVIASVAVLMLIGSHCRADESHVGLSAVDITPDYPVRLSGFGFRRTESEGVTQHIWAKAIAIGQENSAVIVTVDNLGVPSYMRQDVAQRLAKKANLDPNRFAITSSHTHTAPMLTNVCRTLFGRPIVPEEQANIDRYTKELADYIEKAALAALADRKPARLEFGIGTGDLAMNRRTKDGPVDHDLPVLAVRAPDGKLRGVYVSYACHCVTLSNNKVSGDWAGFLQEQLQTDNPGAIALTSIGCGADSNPKSGVTGDKIDVAAEQGKKLAAEVQRMLKSGTLAPIKGKVEAKAAEVELMFDTPPTREQLQKTADANQEYVSHHARMQLERLDRGEALQAKLPYLIQTWTFGGADLAMVFLPGEVVVDYSLRLKREFDRSRLWVNAYSNDVPCYIPSERILKEGGYEGGGAMTFYDRPTRLASGVEQKIIDEVHRQLPETFAAPKGTEGVAPKSPEASLRTIRTKPGLEVELVAAEPLVTSPVAIDWGADGRLWVCEMFDYPTGVDQNWQPGGRVKFLEDTDGDGRYDKATVFLDNLPFPTGVTSFLRGVLVCAAPDILYAEDADRDGKADKVVKLFSGFATENYQARVNSLAIGLDRWIYGANGLLGGTITDVARKQTLDIRNHDFRFRPLRGPVETVSGLTQQGRARDDWGRWFGCDNGSAMIYYPRDQHYLARNPHVPPPPPLTRPPGAGGYDVARVYPISRPLERFNDPAATNQFTAGCGLGVYRDTLLGEEFYGNVFTCEPVNNLVHRMIPVVDDATGFVFARKRAPDEAKSEFLASTDNWFRPVQARTGPDGALYVVDMYRFLIEHPRWIPAERLAQIDARAGSQMGRIYRVKPAGTRLRAVTDLTKLSDADFARAIDHANGVERDRVQVHLMPRHHPEVVGALESVARDAESPAVRLQALSALDWFEGLGKDVVLAATRDEHPHVRKIAVRLAEQMFDRVGGRLLELADDPAPLVRHQLAYTLGQWDDPRSGAALAKLATANLADDEMRVAVLSSAGGRHCKDVLAAVTGTQADAPGREKWIAPLVATAAASDDPGLLARALSAVLPAENAEPTTTQFQSLAALLDAMERRNAALAQEVRGQMLPALTAARRIAGDEKREAVDRAAAASLLGRGEAPSDELDLLCRLAIDQNETIRNASLVALRRQTSSGIPDRLLKSWRQTSPSARPALVNLVLSRDEWTLALLDAVKRNVVGRSEVPIADRQRFTADGVRDDIRALAAEVFVATKPDANRQAVLDRYASVGKSTGDAARGGLVFDEQCAACHLLNAVGYAVGPDLSILRDRDADYFVKNILDPSSIVEPRFTNYQVVLKDRRVLSGLITSETAAGFTLQGGSGTSESVARADVKDIRAAKISMMPEGLEAAISPEQMADLIAFIKSANAPRAAATSRRDNLPRDPASLAKTILDPTLTIEAREAAVNANPQFAAELIAEMTRDLKPGDEKTEYDRIPWIWRVAIACGKRDDPAEVKSVLDVSLPKEDQPLRDWQAVVIGGGIINGISQRGAWPAARLAEIIGDDKPLKSRWQRSLDLAGAMADEEKVRSGTRYDALRMLGCEPWEKRGEHLARYLAKGTHAELQMGAVSALADVDSPKAAAALTKALPDLTPENRKLAEEGLKKRNASSAAPNGRGLAQRAAQL